MRQKPAVIQDIQEIFHLSNTERTFLLTAAVGEGILLMDDEHSEIKIVASEEEHRQITTNPDEILKQDKKPEEQKQIEVKPNETPKQTKKSKSKRKQIKPKRKNVATKALAKQRSHKVKVDADKRFFRHKDLSLDDLKYLLAKGYREADYLGVNGKREKYVIKPRENESNEHFFLIFDIAEYLKGYADRIELFETSKPDIIFEYKSNSYAIEIETGKLYEKARDQLMRKVGELKKNFGERYCFVVTNREFAPVYSNFGKTFTRKTFIKQFQKWLEKH